MKKDLIAWQELMRIFLWTGASSFGGWPTTMLLLEKYLVRRRYLTAKQLEGATAYAQVLPGATQVAIVSNTGYRLRGVWGAFVATVMYLLPTITLITLFGAVYFRFAESTRLSEHLGGLIAALGGVIMANAYHIGQRHTSRYWLWGLVAAACLGKLWLGLNAVVIILSFGVAGFLLSWKKPVKSFPNPKGKI